VGLGGVGAASGQEQQPTEKVIVTGSAIPRTETETPAPVQVITREEIAKTGATSVFEVLRQLTTNGNSNLNQNFSGAFAAGAAGVSLRGMTVDATLVLIDGKRMAPYPISDDGQRSFVDVANLPLSIIDRIEILKDSGSALYGSDAIAGVVNIITAKTFVGSQIAGDFGDSTHNDGITYHVAATHGWGDLAADGHNTYVNVEYRHQDAIPLTDRAKYANFDFFHTYGNGAPTLPGVVQPGAAYPITSTLYGMTVPITGAGTPGAAIDGTRVSNLGCPHVDPLGGCAYNPAQYYQVQPDTEQLNLWLRHSQQLTPDWQITGTASVFESKSQQLNPPTSVGPLAGAWASLAGHVNTTAPQSQPVVLPPQNRNNPYCGLGSNPATCTTSAWLAYAFGDVGAPNLLTDTSMYRVALDLSGSVLGWDTTTSVGWVRGISDISYVGFPLYSGLLDVIANNTYTLGPTPADIAANNAAGVYNVLDPTTSAVATSQMQYFELNGTRDLFALPGGPMGVGVGVSLHHWGQSDPGEPQSIQGNVIGFGTTFIDGTETDQAAHLEISVPALKQVEMDGQVRFDKVVGVGTAISPKGLFKVTPIEQISVRGTYARGFRAPGPGEKGNSGVTFFTTLPSDSARCPTTHLPTDCASATGFGALVGNSSLSPEKSEAYSGGVILEPIKSISVSADWYRIRRNNYILGGLANQIIRGPVQPAFPTLPGPVLGIVGPYANLGHDQTSGLEFDAQIKHDFGEIGTASSHITWTHLIYYDLCGINYPGIPPNGCVDVAGTHGPSGISGNTGTPKDRGEGIFSFDRGPYEGGFQINYVSGYSLADPSFGANGLGQPGGCLDPWFPGCHISSFTDVDLFGHYDVNKKFQVNAHILNVFDRDAPLDPQANYTAKNYSSNWAQQGAVGRFYQIGARYVF
jgi:iron complex outermembrane recepter protein